MWWAHGWPGWHASLEWKVESMRIYDRVPNGAASLVSEADTRNGIGWVSREGTWPITYRRRFILSGLWGRLQNRAGEVNMLTMFCLEKGFPEGSGHGERIKSAAFLYKKLRILSSFMQLICEIRKALFSLPNAFATWKVEFQREHLEC